MEWGFEVGRFRRGGCSATLSISTRRGRDGIGAKSNSTTFVSTRCS